MKVLRIAILALLLSFVGTTVTPATAAVKNHYKPRHGKPCNKNYKKRFHRVQKHKRSIRVRICVKRKHRSAFTVTKTTRLSAHLAPGQTRFLVDPYKVAYDFSASATQRTTSFAVTTEEPTETPPGVLALYSDGRLECAINVGGAVNSGECAVDYSELGQHRVTTIYTSGEQSATETEIKTIEPLATTTTLSFTYTPRSATQVPGTGGEWWSIGELDTHLGAEPNGSGLEASLGCADEPINGRITPSGCYQMDSGDQHSLVYVSTQCEEVSSDPAQFKLVMDKILITGRDPHPELGGNLPSATQIEAGSLVLRANIFSGAGYTGSETTVPLQFTPTLAPGPSCGSGT